MKYFEPRWDREGKPIAGVPVEIVLDDRHQVVDGEHCGILPRCWSCEVELQRQGSYHSATARYLTLQPTGDIAYDYVYGGAWNAARATLCAQCCPCRQSVEKKQPQSEIGIDQKPKDGAA